MDTIQQQDPESFEFIMSNLTEQLDGMETGLTAAEKAAVMQQYRETLMTLKAPLTTEQTADVISFARGVMQQLKLTDETKEQIAAKVSQQETSRIVEEQNDLVETKKELAELEKQVALKRERIAELEAAKELSLRTKFAAESITERGKQLIEREKRLTEREKRLAAEVAEGKRQLTVNLDWIISQDARLAKAGSNPTEEEQRQFEKESELFKKGLAEDHGRVAKELNVLEEEGAQFMMEL